MNAEKSAKELVEHFYDSLGVLDLEGAMEVLHPDYRSLTSEVEPSRDAFRDYYAEAAKHIKGVSREVQLVMADAPWVGILQTFKYEYHDGSVERSHSSDFYRIEDGLFIEHQGVTLAL